MKKVFVIISVIILITGVLSAQEVPPLKFGVTGDMFYSALAQTSATDSFKIDNIKINLTSGLKFFNRRNLAGMVLFRINSDSTIYKTTLHKFFINYFAPGFKMTFFYKYRVENYNDGFRLLDDDINSFYQPVIFYNDSKLKRLAYWGKDYTGLKFSINKFVNQELIFARNVENAEVNKFSVISRTVKDFNLSDNIELKSGLNFIYVKQGYTLPEVNSSSWAEYNGVWYEFNTNSFYDPDNDYTVKASGELAINLFNRFNIWSEAGIDNKYGGYYGETTQKATSSGNISYNMVLNSAGYKKTLYGGGMKIDLDFLMLDASYKIVDSKIENFNIISNALLRSENDVTVNFLNVNLYADFDFFQTTFNFQLENSGESNHKVFFDKYNFKNRFYIYSSKVIRIRSFNKIDLGFIALLPELEFSKYSNNFTTMEINGGFEVSLYKKLKLYGNVRYKNYVIDDINKKIVNPFVSFRYSYNKKIYFEFGYGLDNRLLYDYDYGFEYALNDYISSDYSDTLLPAGAVTEAEDNFAKNNYIFITGHIGF